MAECFFCKAENKELWECSIANLIYCKNCLQNMMAVHPILTKDGQCIHLLVKGVI